MGSDSPPASWYEPIVWGTHEDAEIEDDEPTVPEILTIDRGVVWWTAAPIETDD